MAVSWLYHFCTPLDWPSTDSLRLSCEALGEDVRTQSSTDDSACTDNLSNSSETHEKDLIGGVTTKSNVTNKLIEEHLNICK